MHHQELIEGLRIGPQVLRDFTAAIPEERLHLRRGEGFWTLHQHVEHLAAVQLMLYRRLERFTKEERPEFVPYLPDREQDKAQGKPKALGELLSFYSRWRERQLELIEGGGRELWTKSAIHPEYEQYGFEILVRHILLHDYFHLYRMEELWLTKEEYLTRL
jgi:uncharacterized damage-inducible protein DinB